MVWTAILHGLDCIGNINAWYLYYLCYWYLWILCLLVVYGKINIDNTWKIFIIHHINIRNRILTIYTVTIDRFAAINIDKVHIKLILVLFVYGYSDKNF